MLHKAMEVLELFTPTRREIGVLEAAERLGRPKSTISRWLRAMDAAGFLDRDAETAKYRVGMRVAALGELARQSTSLQRLAHPALEWLTERTGETSNLVVLDVDVAVNIALVESPRPIKHVGWLGRRLPLHATAAGKALVAWTEEDVCPAPAAGGGTPERFTERTITDPDALRTELARVRSRGYAVAWAELEADLAGVGAPVRDHRGAVVGAATLSVPLTRISRDDVASVARTVCAAARRVSDGLGHRSADGVG